MLEVRNLGVDYGQHRALDNVFIRVEPGEIAVILGANGAGKSTLLRAIGGLCEGTVRGEVDMGGAPILGLPPHRIVEHGIALVPEDRGIFADLTVRENLLLGAYAQRARDDQMANLDRVLALFPKLAERQTQVVRTMSGGEQQMVAIGRAVMSNPQILMLDEPSLGLSPLLCKELFGNLAEVRRAGMGILLVEQNAKQSLAIADRGYLLENAHIVGEGTAAGLRSDPAVQKAYLGAGAGGHIKTSGPSETGTPVDRPPTIVPSRQPEPRLRASDLIGQNIDDLVGHASEVQSDHVAAHHPTIRTTDTEMPSQAPAPNTGSDLQRTLNEIEQAARNARRPVERPTPPPTKPDEPCDAGERPKVAVWKRPPRIEIYHRTAKRPGKGKNKGEGRMTRIKGENDGENL
jgi:branched-chain amino acid transport system ATP-binding protein